MIDLDDAALFLRLCETENLTRAAALSNVSPSTLSRTLNRIESQLKTRLCIRDQRGIRITPSGRSFERFARKTLHDYANLETMLNAGSDLIRGSVKIFCSVTASYVIIPRLISELRLSHPNLELHLQTGDPAMALKRLQDPSTDAVIAALPDQVPEHINYVHLVDFPLVLIAPRSPGYSLSGFDEQAPDISKVPFVMPEGGMLRHEVEKWFSKQHKTPNVYAEIAGHEAIVSVTALGFGLSIVPKVVVDLSPFKNDVQILSQQGCGEFHIALCHLKSRAHEHGIEAIHKLAQRLAPTFSSDLISRRLS